MSSKAPQTLFQGRVLLPVAVALLVLLTMSAALYMHHLAAVAADLHEQSSHRLLLLNKMLNNLRMTEAAQRDFLLTGLPRYLAPYEKGRQDAAIRLTELQGLYARNPMASTLLMKIGRWQELRLEELEDGLEVQRTLGSEYTRILTGADGGRSFMRQIEANAAELETLENEGHRSLKALTQQRRQATVGAGIGQWTPRSRTACFSRREMLCRISRIGPFPGAPGGR